MIDIIGIVEVEAIARTDRAVAMTEVAMETDITTETIADIVWTLITLVN